MGIPRCQYVTPLTLHANVEKIHISPVILSVFKQTVISLLKFTRKPNRWKDYKNSGLVIAFVFGKTGRSWVASTPHSIMHPYAIRSPIDLLEQKRFLRCLLGQLDWSSYYTRRTFINSHLFFYFTKVYALLCRKRHHNLLLYSEMGNSMRAWPWTLSPPSFVRTRKRGVPGSNGQWALGSIAYLSRLPRQLNLTCRSRALFRSRAPSPSETVPPTGRDRETESVGSCTPNNFTCTDWSTLDDHILYNYNTKRDVFT